MNETRQVQIHKIKKWVEEGKQKELTRKHRNKVLIHLGLGVIGLIKNNHVELVDLMRNMDEKTQELTIQVLANEKGIK